MRNIQYSLDAIVWSKFYTGIHFNMVYYSIILDEYIHNVFTIVLPFVRVMHWGLPMGIFIGPYVLQEKMSNLFQDVVHACICMDDLVIVRNNVFQNHVYILDEVLNWLEKPVMQVNAVKYEWDHNSVSYLGFVVMLEKIKPHPFKVESITVLEPPKKQIQIIYFIEMVNLYHYLWK